MSARGAYYRHGSQWTPLYRVREAAGVTQAQAALAIGVSERTYRTREALPQFVVSAAIVAAFREISPNPAMFDRGVAGLGAIAAKAAGRTVEPAAIAPSPSSLGFRWKGCE